MAFAGTIFYPLSEQLASLPSAQAANIASHYRLLRRAPKPAKFIAKGLYPGRSLDFQTNLCHGVRFAPTPHRLFPDEDDGDARETAEVRFVAARTYDGTLAPSEDA